MIKINGHLYERADYCKILSSGSPQICQADATNIITETGDIFPIDTIVESVDIGMIADMGTALDVLGVSP